MMREQIKELCIFMICGQTLLYFQSGKKYEKICRMILELLVLAGIVGMILNFLQSLGLRGGEMQAAGGAVAGMQRSMEEALSRQLDMESLDENFMSGIPMESLVKKYTEQEIRYRYNYLARQYGMEIEKVEQSGEKLRVFLKEIPGESTAGGGEGWQGTTEDRADEAGAGDLAEISPIQQVEIDRIRPGEGREDAANGAGEDEEDTANGTGDAGEREGAVGERGEETVTEGPDPAGTQTGERELEELKRQLALVLTVDKDKLEVILVES